MFLHFLQFLIGSYSPHIVENRILRKAA